MSRRQSTENDAMNNWNMLSVGQLLCEKELMLTPWLISCHKRRASQTGARRRAAKTALDSLVRLKPYGLI
jgi:hypothetical protein